MDVKKMMEQNADRFLMVKGRGTAQQFKSNLETELYDYNENEDKLYFLYRIHSVKNKEYQEHEKVCKHPDTCDTSRTLPRQVYFIEQMIKDLNPSFTYTLLRPNVNSNLIKRNLVDLSEYPKAGEILQSAMDKLNESKYERNLIDDLRLCVEVLVKEKLQNEKSLENQAQPLGEYLKNVGVSSELRNLIIKQLDYFGKYQNEHIKHDDDVNQNEVEFIINISSSFIRFFITI